MSLRNFSRKQTKDARFERLFRYDKTLCLGGNTDFKLDHPAESRAGLKGDFTEMKLRIKKQLEKTDAYQKRKLDQRKGLI